MRGVGGNTTAELQKLTATVNAIGEQVTTWQTVATLTGWLDYQAGQAQRASLDAKTDESTHVFVAEWQQLGVSAENARLVVGGEVYDVLLIDDPMGLHYQLELYLDHRGRQVESDG